MNQDLVTQNHRLNELVDWKSLEVAMMGRIKLRETR